jgi:beta-glucosidase
MKTGGAKRSSILSLLLLLMAAACVPEELPYQNPRWTIAARVQDLVSRMTPEEKLWQLFMIPEGLGADAGKYIHGVFGLQVAAQGTSAGVSEQQLHYHTSGSAGKVATDINRLQRHFCETTRLGIPIIPFDEALHGLVRDGATAFPQAIALAATWNPELMHHVATAISRETRSRGIRQILSPVVNLATDVRWGRTEETYGEDPFLSARMATAFVSAFEQSGVVTTPKHLVANVGDGGRDSYPVYPGERWLEQFIFPPFKACIQQGGSRSVMTAYNSLNGTPCSAHSWLLNQKLRREWGFSGFVISDAGAVPGMVDLHGTAQNYPHSAALAVNNGMDVLFQTDDDHFKLFFAPAHASLSETAVDSAVTRVLKVKFSLGLFDDPYTSPAEADIWNGHKAHRQLAEKAALESIVLLKNDHHVLPLHNRYKRIAVIGHDAIEARLGGYSGPGNDKISILDGIKRIAAKGTLVQYHPGCGRNAHRYHTIASSYLSCVKDGRRIRGLSADYFNNIALEDPAVFSRIDPAIDFSWTLVSPEPGILQREWYSVRWQGTLAAPGTGTWQLGVEGNDGFRLFIDDSLLIDQWRKVTHQTRVVDFRFEQGREYRIRLEFFECRGDAHVKLIWNVGDETIVQDRKIAEAVALARQSDGVVVVVGLEEGEFKDRALLSLPGLQSTLIKRLAATGKPVVVVIVGGSAVTMSDWMDKVGAIIDVWYPGEAGGSAVADVLFGRYNPAGRLPITFPQHEGQLPLYYQHAPTGRGNDYTNLTGESLFPFGYGLSYSRFDYSDLQIEMQPDRVIAKCRITNSGRFDGDEVVQLYVQHRFSALVQPIIQLKEFKRIHLQTGHSMALSFELPLEALAVPDELANWRVEPGEYKIMVGSSSRDIRLMESCIVPKK